MGRIKTTFIKDIAKGLYEKHGDKFTTSFEENKKIIAQFMIFQSNRLRNIVAGYLTKLKKQQK